MADTNFIPQVDYTSRDYASIREDLINLIPTFAPQWTSRDLGDPGIAILEIFAFMADSLHYYIDRAANESFISTASQRESVLRIAKMLGYTPTDTTAALVELTFKNSTEEDIVVPAKTQIASTTIVNGSSTQVIFETDEEITVTPDSETPNGVEVLATQGYTVYNEIVGISEGTANQVFTLSDSPVIQDSIEVTSGGTVYNSVQYLIESAGTDAVFTSSTDSDGFTSIEFGDSVGGRIPASNSQISVTYRVGGGVAGNVSANTITNILTNFSSGLTVNNPLAASGGTEIESIESIRINAPLSVSAGDRAVSLADYSSLAVQVTGVAKAIAAADQFTSVNLYVSPFGDKGTTVGGDLTQVFTNLANKVSAFMQPKMPPGTSLTIFPPSYVAVNITVSVHALPQFKNTTVQTNATKSLNEILAFDNVNFNDRISLSYVMSALANTPGVDYSTVTLLARADGSQSGTSDVVLDFNEIPEAGTITVTVSGGIV